MPLFKKSHKKDDSTNANVSRDDPKFSGSGADPDFMKYDQPGGNNGPGPGYSPSSQQPYPNEGDYGGSGHPETHSKPSKIGGKIETAVGTLIGSHDLRAKGIQKEREARSLNMRSNELAQAESLEREAQMHRDRAMGGGGGNLTSDNSDRRLN